MRRAKIRTPVLALRAVGYKPPAWLTWRGG